MNSLVIGIIILAVLVVAGAVVLILIGLRNPNKANDNMIQDRLEEFIQSGEQVTLEKLEMSQPISERLIYPLARALGELALKFTPQAALEGTRKRIEMAGMSAKLDPTTVLAGQFIFTALLAGIVIFIFSVGTLKLSFFLVLLLAVIFGVLGFYMPTLLLQSMINRRQKNIKKALPDALDLLTICVEAGLGFDAAMQKVSEKWQTELSLAFARVNREVQLGKVRREALRDMADRMAVPELSSFVAAVIQSEQLGVSLSKVLRIQADQMRIKRRQYAEQEAHKAPIKMLIPMALLIFPSLMIVLLTPAAFQLFNSVLFGIMK
jgi:tight adherence protein C